MMIIIIAMAFIVCLLCVSHCTAHFVSVISDCPNSSPVRWCCYFSSFWRNEAERIGTVTWFIHVWTVKSCDSEAAVGGNPTVFLDGLSSIHSLSSTPFPD